VRLFGYPTSHALTVSASLAQIGEFSFILAGLGVSLALLPERARDLILAGAIISILLNPVLFAYLDRYLGRVGPEPEPKKPEVPVAVPASATAEPLPVSTLKDHIVLIGYGRVGRLVSAGLKGRRVPLLVIDLARPLALQAHTDGFDAIHGNAASPEILTAANLGKARGLLVAIPDAFEGGQIVAQARAIDPRLPIMARSHSEEETEHLKKFGANKVVMGEEEIAKAMLAELPKSAV
jgi:CPA2 family monovalent cation:H+ antiporter-2